MAAVSFLASFAPRPDSRTPAGRRALRAAGIAALAGRVLEGLIELRRARARMLLAEAGHLAALRERREYLTLGHVRFSDVCREVLLVSSRTARRRIAFRGVCDRVPAVASAFLDGRLCVTRALLLAPVVDDENASVWIPRAQRLSVAALRERVAEARSASAPGLEEVEEPERHRLSFLAPRSVGLALEHGIETARSVLGWDAPRDECLAAILDEAESSFPDDGSTGVDRSVPCIGPAGRLSEPDVPYLSERAWRRRHGDLSARPRRRSRDDGVPVDRHDIQAARRTLSSLRRTMDRLGSGARRRDPSGDAGAGTQVRRPSDVRARLRRLRWIQDQDRPLRVLQARLVHHFLLLHGDRFFGFHDLDDLGERALGSTGRTVRHLLQEGYVFRVAPRIADSYRRGEIGLAHVHLLGGRIPLHRPDWIDRPRSITVRQFHREVGLLRRIDRCFPGGLPVSPRAGIDAERARSIESSLVRRLLDRGGDPAAVLGGLEEAGLVFAVGDSRDPAENPVVLARLETLLDALVLQTCRTEEVAPEPGARKTVSTRGRHHRFVVWVRHETLERWRRLRARIRRLCGHWPDWAVATVLVQAALEQWTRHDPDRIPVERRILERDGYRCQAPGCSSRRRLEAHHIVYRSRGGTNAPANLVTLCHAHHHHAVHRGTLTVSGSAPHALVWEFGIAGNPSLRRVYHGDRRTDGRAHLRPG